MPRPRSNRKKYGFDGRLYDDVQSVLKRVNEKLDSLQSQLARRDRTIQDLNRTIQNMRDEGGVGDPQGQN